MDPPQPFPLRKVRRRRRVGSPGTYKGVRMRAWGKWVSEIRVPKTGQRIWLGSYDSPEKAARAYDAAQYCIRGEGGQFNFPAEKRPELPRGSIQTLSKSDIKAIALNFASSNVSAPSERLVTETRTETRTLSKEEPVLISPLGSRAMRDAADASVLQTAPNSMEDFQLDDFLMLDIEWIDSL